MSACCTWLLCVPAMNFMQPETLLAGEKASHTVITSGDREAPVSRVLVPGDEARIARLLDEERRIPAVEVRAQHVFDRVENFRVADEIIDPGKQHVAAMAHAALDRPAC